MNSYYGILPAEKAVPVQHDDAILDRAQPADIPCSRRNIWISLDKIE